MNDLQNELIDLGLIDAPLITFKINDWFDNMIISFVGNNDKTVICEFNQCFEIVLSHDKNYSKNIKADKTRDYEYFVQNITIEIIKEIYHVEISAWPLDATIECKNIQISFKIE